MRILYVGALFYVEHSLYHEAKNNKNIEVLFCSNSPNLPYIDAAIGSKQIKDGQDIDALRNSFKPDLVIFRNWSGSEHFMTSNDLLWAQEITPKDIMGVYMHDGVAYPTQAKHIADCSKVSSDKNNRIWFPYCVSKHYSRQKVVKDIPVMVATNIPNGKWGEIKMHSVSILLKQFSERNPSLVYAFEGLHGGLAKFPYLLPCMKPSYDPLQSIHTISRAKIYVSPTSIWYDEGYVSYKTIEAMACGVTVLTNKYIGMEEMFGKDGENLIYANTPEESFDKIQYYLAHDKEREEVAMRGYEFIHKERNWETHLNRVFDELNRQI